MSSSRWCEDHGDWDSCAYDAMVEAQRAAYEGQAATLVYPDDRYPMRVVKRTPKTITLIDVVLETTARGEPWPVVEGRSQEDDLPRLMGGRSVKAHWSEKQKGWFVAGSTPIYVGTAHYRRDYSL